jgi:PKD repeat protein
MKNLNLLLVGIISVLVISCTPDPTAVFSYTGSTEVGEVITFSNQSENADSYLWDFGDQTTSTLEAPTHEFPTPGTFAVTLTSTGKKGSISSTQTINITGITYSFNNTCDFDLPEFVSFYYDGTDIYDFVEHGTVSAHEITDPIVTERRSIYFGLVVGGTSYISAEYDLDDNQANVIIINDYTPIYSRKKTSTTIKDILSK